MELSELPSGFGRVLALHRTRQELSQSRLAVMTGLSHGFISRLESGTRMPDRETVAELAAALQLTPSEAAHLFWTAGFTYEGGHPPITDPLLSRFVAIYHRSAGEIRQHLESMVLIGLSLAKDHEFPKARTVKVGQAETGDSLEQEGEAGSVPDLRSTDLAS